MIDLDLYMARIEDLWRCLDVYSGVGFENLGEMRLGGGTALAMHWQHRHSTDFDLSMPIRSVRGILRGNDALIEETMRGMKTAGLIKKWRKGRRGNKPILSWKGRDFPDASLVGGGLGRTTSNCPSRRTGNG